MLALAHHLQGAIDRGLVPDRAAVARRLGFTRARVTQIVDLLLLASDLQVKVLEMEAADGLEPTSVRGRLRVKAGHQGCTSPGGERRFPAAWRGPGSSALAGTPRGLGRARLRSGTACDGFDVRERLDAIQAAALVVCGTEEALTPPKYSEYLRDHLARAQLELVPGSGHMVMLEAPAEVAAAVESFLQQRMASSPGG